MTDTDLSTLKPAPGARPRKKRAGRGHAGYGGKTCGKGMNGQQARKSPDIRPQFEGGQTPMYRRLPKKQYIAAFNRRSHTVLNLDDLERLAVKHGAELTPEQLLESGALAKLENAGLKILGRGELKTKLKISAHACSASAKAKIEAAGGTLTILD